MCRLRRRNFLLFHRESRKDFAKLSMLILVFCSCCKVFIFLHVFLYIQLNCILYDQDLLNWYIHLQSNKSYYFIFLKTCENGLGAHNSKNQSLQCLKREIDRTQIGEEFKGRKAVKKKQPFQMRS